MKIYLDVSCLNRPFDDQAQARIRLESEATTIILEQCELGDWQHVSSEMATIEITAMPDADRRARVQLLLPSAKSLLRLSEAVFARAGVLESLGFKPADAVHVAAAEALDADIFLSCDDRLCRLAKRRVVQLKVLVANPVDWLKEIGHDPDLG
jgi:predicted nucleic acid-binding protein